MFLSVSEQRYTMFLAVLVGLNVPVATPSVVAANVDPELSVPNTEMRRFGSIEKDRLGLVLLGTIISVVSDCISTSVQLRFASFKRITPITTMSARKEYGTLFRMALS
jgi:hypothetical protein